MALFDLDEERCVNRLAPGVVDGEPSIGRRLQRHRQIEIADAAVEEKLLVISFADQLVIDLDHGRIGFAGKAIVIAGAGRRREHRVLDAGGGKQLDLVPRER